MTSDAKRANTRRARVIKIVVGLEVSGLGLATPHFHVHDGERYLDRLNWDEMLGTVARLTHPKLQGESSYGGPRTPEEYMAQREARARRQAAKNGGPA